MALCKWLISIAVGASLLVGQGGVAYSQAPGKSEKIEDCDDLPDALLKSPPPHAEPFVQFCAALYFESTTEDKLVAFARYLNLAETGYPLAQVIVGEYYWRGIGVKKDVQLALEWYLKAAEQGNSSAQNNYGFIYFYGDDGVAKDRAMALKWLKKAADQGNPHSQTLVAEAYSTGEGLPKDDVAAFELYKKAAEADHIHAQYMLGFHYLRGRGTTQDYERALYWLELSAYKYYADAQYELGRIYSKGLGVPKDNETAYVWFYAAANNNKKVDPPPQLAELEKQLTPVQIINAKKDAAWLIKPSQK